MVVCCLLFVSGIWWAAANQGDVMSKRIVVRGLNPTLGVLTAKLFRSVTHTGYADASRDTQVNGAGETLTEEPNRTGTYFSTVAALITDGAAGDLTGPHEVFLYDAAANFIGVFDADLAGAGTAAVPIVCCSSIVNVGAWRGTSPATPETAGVPAVNAVALSGDSTAADNAEAFFDGTGYAGTNNVIPTVTNLTNAATNGDLTATMKGSVNTEADAAIADAALATAANLQLVDDLVDDLELRLTAARAGYLDNLNVGGAVASQAETAAIQADTDAIQAVLGSPAGASLAADVAAVKVDTAATKVKSDQMVFTVANKIDATAEATVDNGAIAAAIVAALLNKPSCDGTANYTTINGVSAHLKACLVNLSDAVIIDPAATCVCTVTMDPDTTGGERVPVEDFTAAEFGAPNAAGYFELEWSDPGLTSMRGFIAEFTITSDGVDYPGRSVFNSQGP